MGKLLVLLFLIMSRGELDIDSAKQREDKRLQQSNQEFKKVKGYRDNETYQIGDRSAEGPASVPV